MQPFAGVRTRPSARRPRPITAPRFFEPSPRAQSLTPGRALPSHSSEERSGRRAGCSARRSRSRSSTRRPRRPLPRRGQVVEAPHERAHTLVLGTHASGVDRVGRVAGPGVAQGGNLRGGLRVRIEIGEDATRGSAPSPRTRTAPFVSCRERMGRTWRPPSNDGAVVTTASWTPPVWGIPPRGRNSPSSLHILLDVECYAEQGQPTRLGRLLLTTSHPWRSP
jgi:hypothetical protein